MIQFEITKSPDSNVMTTFKFFRNDIYLGSATGDVVIRDPSVNKSHLMLEVVEGDFLVHPQKDVPYYLINGKRSTSIRKIKPSDILTIGETEIKLIAFEWSEPKSKKTILNQKLANLVESNSPHITVIEKLSKLMK